MKITVAAVGKLKDRMVARKIEQYAGRFGKAVKLEFREVADGTIEKEADGLLSRIPERAVVVALDERGEQVDSRGFAGIISETVASGRDLAFVLGGPDGLHEKARRSADRVLAFSRLTLPHELARLILVEQIYRAFTIIRNEPYHR